MFLTVNQPLCYCFISWLLAIKKLLSTSKFPWKNVNKQKERYQKTNWWPWMLATIRILQTLRYFILCDKSWFTVLLFRAKIDSSKQSVHKQACSNIHSVLLTLWIDFVQRFTVTLFIAKSKIYNYLFFLLFFHR